MKKMLFLLVVVAMCAAFVPTASAKNSYYNFTFYHADGITPFCDGMSLVLYGVPKTLVDGVQTGCYSGYNTNGFKAAVSPYYQFSATGATMLLGTATNYPYSLIYLVNPTYHTWLNWESGAGAGEFVINYGYWTNGVDAAQQKGTKASGSR